MQESLQTPGNKFIPPNFIPTIDDQFPQTGIKIDNTGKKIDNTGIKIKYCMKPKGYADQGHKED